jgi:hypothetical protein
MWKTLPSSCEVSYVQITHTVWTQVSDNEWIYYTPGVDSLTVLCADRNPVDIPLKGAGKLKIDPTCKGYSRAALLQPMREIHANSSNSGANKLIQVQLNNECCEELGTRLNFRTLNLDLNFRETVSHTDDLKYAGVRIKDLEKHSQEHEWKEKHSFVHHGYSIVLYVIVSLLILYVVFRLVRYVWTKGTCRGVAGALRITSRVAANPESAGSGNVVNINIKTSNESLAAAPETIPLRALTPSGGKTGEPEARSTRRLRPSRTYF